MNIDGSLPLSLIFLIGWDRNPSPPITSAEFNIMQSSYMRQLASHTARSTMILSLVTFVRTELWSSSAPADDSVPLALSSRIRIQRESFDAACQLRDRRLAIEPGRIERAMP